MSQAKTFGRYNLIRKVAQGGMAEIFLAKFQGIGGFEKKIIIKRILPRFSENQEFIKMLIHEAKTAVQLHHQNVVQIYDLGKVRDTYYISMEYIRGKDLRTILNRLKSQGQIMPRELAVYIAREICKGLDYAHNITDSHGEPLSLVHRDISPPNVLLSLEGEVKIIDFGIAKATSQATDTQAGVFKGKFAYMAPEQALGIPVDRRADIFATGLILWEMLTCKKLLEAESDIATLERAKKIDSFHIPFGDLTIPDQLEHIIRKGLKQDRNVRYQSAGEMARDLTIYLNLNYPGFSETDLADFLRTLFNLDKRRAGGGGDMITHGQGERSLTGSDFFRALAQTGQESTDPSVKVSQDRTPKGGLTPTAQDATPGKVAAAAVAAMPTAGRRKPDGRPGAEGDYWSLENDIRDEIEVFAMGSNPATQGEEAAAPTGGQVGWVSQLAEDFVRAEDGTLHPLIIGGLREDDVGQDPAGPEDPTILVQDGKVLHLNPALNIANTDHRPVQRSAQASSTPIKRPAPILMGHRNNGRGAAIWGGVGVALMVVLVMGAVVFPDKLHSFKRSLGLVSTADVGLSFEPADAQVRVDGILRSGLSGSGTLELAVGKPHELEFKKEGFTDQKIVVDLTGRREHEPVQVRLEPIAPKGNGRLRLEGLLPDAQVYVNSRPTTSEELTSLAIGEPLAIRVIKEHYLPFETQVTLGAEPLSLKVGLEPRPVKLTVNGAPPNALVRIDGREAGACCPFEGENFQPGKVYKIEVSAPGHEPYAKPWTPEIGSPLQLHVSLLPSPSGKSRPPSGAPTSTAPSRSPVPAAIVAEVPAIVPPSLPDPPVARARDTVQVTILASPWAEIYIDGKFMGKTPVRNVTVKIGRHKLRIVNADLQIDYTADKDISLTPDGSTLVYNFELG